MNSRHFRLSLVVLVMTCFAAVDIPTFANDRVNEVLDFVHTKLRVRESKARGSLLADTAIQAYLVAKHEAIGGFKFGDVEKEVFVGNSLRQHVARHARQASPLNRYSRHSDADLRIAARNTFQLILPDIVQIAGKGRAGDIANSYIKFFLQNSNDFESPYARVRSQKELSQLKDRYLDTATDAALQWRVIVRKDEFARQIDKLLFAEHQATPASDMRLLTLLGTPEGRRLFPKGFIENFTSDDGVTIRLDAGLAEGVLGTLNDSSLEEAKDAIQEIEAALDPKAQSELTESQRRERLQVLDAEWANDNQRLDQFNNAITFLSLLSGDDDADVHLLAHSGRTTVEIARALNNYTRSLQQESLVGEPISRFASVGLSLNVYVAIANFMSSLTQGSKSDSAKIMEQLGRLEKLVGDIHEHLNARLDRVDRNLATIFEHMQERLSVIEGKIDTTSLQVAELQSFVATMDDRIRKLRDTNRDLMKAGFDRQLMIRTQSCLDDEFFDAPKEDSEYRQCLVDLKTFATQVPTGVISVGNSISQNEKNLQSAIRSGFSKDEEPWDQIRFLSDIAYRGFRYPHLQRRDLANPVDWSTYGNAYVDLAMSWPRLYKKYPAVGLTDEIISTGDSINAVLLNITTRDVDGSRIGNTQFLNGLIDYYDACFANLVDGIERERKAFEQNKAKGAEGYDMFLGAEQEPRKGLRLAPFSQSEIPPFQGYLLPHTPHKDSPEKQLRLSTSGTISNPFATAENRKAIKKLIPAPYLIAHHLGLGKVNLTYKGVEWVQIGYTRPGPGFAIALTKEEGEKLDAQAAVSGYHKGVVSQGRRLCGDFWLNLVGRRVSSQVRGVDAF